VHLVDLSHTLAENKDREYLKCW